MMHKWKQVLIKAKWRLLRLSGVGLLITAIFSGCTSPKKDLAETKRDESTMNILIQKKITLPAIPSGSGLEIIKDKIYIIGDDSPYLYLLNHQDYKTVAQVSLFKTKLFFTGRIPKAFKPDLECLTQVNYKGKTFLLAFGSGSAPTRAMCYSIQIPEDSSVVPSQVKEISVKALYVALQKDKKVVADDLLNLEAAAADSQHIYLMQRSAASGPNALVMFKKDQFLEYLFNPTIPLPTYQTFLFQLPGLQNLSSRFSGAHIFQNKLFFTASVENTADAILDGEVLGSFIGWIPLTDLKSGTSQDIFNTALILDESGAPSPVKVESLVVTAGKHEKELNVMAVTDNDNGESDLLKLVINLE